MMEKVELFDNVPRWTNKEIINKFPWATTGKTTDRERNIITSLELDSAKQEQVNLKLQAKYRICEAEEVRFEKIQCDDAEYLFVSFGLSARICQKAIELAEKKGY